MGGSRGCSQQHKAFAYCILLNMLYILFVLLGKECKVEDLFCVFLGLLWLFYFWELVTVKE